MIIIMTHKNIINAVFICMHGFLNSILALRHAALQTFKGEINQLRSEVHQVIQNIVYKLCKILP